MQTLCFLNILQLIHELWVRKSRLQSQQHESFEDLSGFFETRAPPSSPWEYFTIGSMLQIFCAAKRLPAGPARF